MIEAVVIGLLVMLARHCKGHWSKITLGFFASLVLTLGITDAVFNELAGSSFNDAIWFHLRYGLEGAGIGDFKPLIFKFSSILALSLLVIWFAVLRSSRQPRLIVAKDQWAVVLGLLILSAAATLHPFSQAAWRVLHPPQISEPFVDFYVMPEINYDPGVRKTPPPNLVWIYAESLERTYLDESLFPGLTPGLKELESKSASFTNIHQVDSTGSTIAGMVASQCGIPLTTTGGHGNSMNGMTTFLPGVKCLGDLLKEQQYHLTYLGGADLNFAGKGKFYKTHGFEEVLGRNALEMHLTDRSYVHHWGLYDDSLFDFVREKYQTLVESQRKPFALVTLTVDTHHPDGHISRRCNGLKYGNGRNSMLNAVHCSDLLISNLVKDIRKLDRDNNTVIVVSSDHLAMKNSAHKELNSRPRRNLFMVNWPSHVTPRKIDRPAGIFSLAPTVLGFLGYATAGLGLGRNLIENTPTLVEKYDDYNSVVTAWSPQFRKAWRLPQAVKEVKVLPDERRVNVGVSSFSLPVLMSFNANKDLTGVTFPNSEDVQSLFARALSPTRDRVQVLVDECEQMRTNISELKAPADSICWWNTSQSAPIVVEKRTTFEI